MELGRSLLPVFQAWRAAATRGSQLPAEGPNQDGAWLRDPNLTRASRRYVEFWGKNISDPDVQMQAVSGNTVYFYMVVLLVVT